MFGWRNAHDGGSKRHRIRSVDGRCTVVVHRGDGTDDEFGLGDLVLIRRIRGLELADDRWQLTFRPEGQVEIVGKDGARLAARAQRLRPDVAVVVHYPDDD